VLAKSLGSASAINVARDAGPALAAVPATSQLRKSAEEVSTRECSRPTRRAVRQARITEVACQAPAKVTLVRSRIGKPKHRARCALGCAASSTNELPDRPGSRGCCCGRTSMQVEEV
jgi:hypothetical protein